MKKFSEELKVVYKNAYQMKLWKGLAIYPKIIQDRDISDFTPEEKKHYTRKGLRWYVYFSFFNPDIGRNGAFEKHLAPTFGVNRDFPNFDQRYTAIHRLYKVTEEMLQEGHNPLQLTIQDNEIVTIEKAIDFSLSNKKLKVGIDTYKDYEIRAKQLKKFLKSKGMLKRDAHTFSYKVIREFLRQIAQDTSMANRNNVLRVIKALFSEMYKNDLIPENHVAKIDIEKVKSQRFLSYSVQEAKDIRSHLEKVDPVLELFVMFIGFNFLRIKEVARLKVGDLNLEEKTLKVFVKQGKSKIKRIPDDIVNKLSGYDLSEKENLLFHKDEISGKWDRPEKGRAEYYSKRYTKIVRALGFGAGYTIYSNRHTYITIGYKNLRKRLSKDEALDTLMSYTGHDTREAIKKYIHYIDAEIVDEYNNIVE